MNNKSQNPAIKEIYPYPEEINIKFEDGSEVVIQGIDYFTWMPANNTRFKPVPGQVLPKDLKVKGFSREGAILLNLHREEEEDRTTATYNFVKGKDNNGVSKINPEEVATIYDVALLTYDILNKN